MPGRRTNDIPFPSFSLVLNQYSTFNMRLPSYRSSYLLRFHPYPRVKLSQRELLKQTIDDHFSNQREMLTCHTVDRPGNQRDVEEEEDAATPYTPALTVLPEEQHLVDDNVEEAIEGAEVDARPPVRRPSIKILIVDLAALVVRKLAFKTK
ncbi:hypothetical protein AZE42_05738 [Rhizopogon vesiculosus]|uniref:Uncharacterized protein n=1 Tax=Rhizopogon vesiculosus TaxID=180088 RepID=A0A1J8PR90_9AGAM|nr:hypothetical protein AZE42_05738 [Rhizopogon vesiculosus]